MEISIYVVPHDVSRHAMRDNDEWANEILNYKFDSPSGI